MKHKQNIKVGDKVELLREELLDDNYHEYNRTRVAKGTIMEVVAIAPKVCMVKGDGYDNDPYFVNLVMEGTTCPRIRTNFCNIKKIKK